jgi:DNA-binding transcriptional ArsR family regulator
MGWRLKSWDVEAVAAALGAEAERDARRVRRMAERKRREVLTELAGLEAMAGELAEQLRAHRAAPRTARPAAAEPPAGAEIKATPEPPAIRGRRPRRSSLRDSPLSELFRATDARPQAARTREYA